MPQENIRLQLPWTTMLFPTSSTAMTTNWIYSTTSARRHRSYATICVSYDNYDIDWAIGRSDPTRPNSSYRLDKTRGPTIPHPSWTLYSSIEMVARLAEYYAITLDILAPKLLKRNCFMYVKYWSVRPRRVTKIAKWYFLLPFATIYPQLLSKRHYCLRSVIAQTWVYYTAGLQQY